MNDSLEILFDDIYSEFGGLFPEYSKDELEEIIERDLDVNGMILDEHEVMRSEGFGFDVDYIIEQIIRIRRIKV